jgi:hypothetical protein
MGEKSDRQVGVPLWQSEVLQGGEFRVLEESDF